MNCGRTDGQTTYDKCHMIWGFVSLCTGHRSAMKYTAVLWLHLGNEIDCDPFTTCLMFELLWIYIYLPGYVALEISSNPGIIKTFIRHISRHSRFYGAPIPIVRQNLMDAPVANKCDIRVNPDAVTRISQYSLINANVLLRTNWYTFATGISFLPIYDVHV